MRAALAENIESSGISTRERSIVSQDCSGSPPTWTETCDGASCFAAQPPSPLCSTNRCARHECESGHARSLLTRSFRYIYSPATRRAASEARGAAARHPGALATEQLYDLAADPNEATELINGYQLLAVGTTAPITGRAETRAADAFANFRRALQHDLADAASGCGV